jgi:RNA polymerase sigma factor (sigma-70 family)
MRGVRNERRLARRAARGDRDAFATIFGRFQQDLYRYCVAILGDPQDAQDALQNTMVKALQALPGEQREIDLKPWLYRIAHNESIELRRRQRPSEPLDEGSAAVGGSLEQSAACREQLRGLLADIDQLPERQRGALVMRELAGLDFEQIGAALDTSPAAARQVLYEARRGLHEMRDGREMECDAITATLSRQDGRTMRRRDIRAHLRDCADCRRFGEEIHARQETLAAISPLPALAAAALLKAALSGASGGAAPAAGGAAGAVGGAAAKAVSAGALLKSAAGVVAIVAVGAVAADHGHLFHPGGAAPDRPTRDPAAAVATGPVAAPTIEESRLTVAPTERRQERAAKPAGSRRGHPPTSVAAAAPVDAAGTPVDVASTRAGMDAKTTAAAADPPAPRSASDAMGAVSEHSHPEHPANLEHAVHPQHPEHPVHPEHPTTPEPAASAGEASGEVATEPTHPEHPAHPVTKAEEPEAEEVAAEEAEESESEAEEVAAAVAALGQARKQG